MKHFIKEQSVIESKIKKLERNNKNRVLRVMYNDVHHEFYILPNIMGVKKIKRNEVDVSCGMYAKNRNVYRALVGKPDRKRTHGRPRHRRQDNV